MRSTVVTLLASGIVIGLAAGVASAAPAHKRHAVPRYTPTYGTALPLTVNKRSWLDPGPAVNVGYGNAYVTANTIYSKTPDQVYDTAHFGNSTLRGQPYAPGRSEPVLEFATGPRVGDLYVTPGFGVNP